MAALGLGIGPAGAHSTDNPATGSYNTQDAPILNLVDSDCTWESNGGSWNFNVAVHIADGSQTAPNSNYDLVPFPGDIVREGRLYSFIDRIQESVTTLNAEFNNTQAGAAGFDYVNGDASYSSGTLNTNTIVVSYFNPTGKDPTEPPGGGTPYYVTGTPVTYVVSTSRPGGNSDCELFASGTNSRLLRAWMYLPQYQYWHTAAIRGPWEACQQRTEWNVSYLCNKDLDFQSTVTHELGHTFGLGHPQDVSGATPTWAHCGSPSRDLGASAGPRYRPVDPAIMCGRYRFNTAKRTVGHLHRYDERSIGRQMRNLL